MTGWFSCCFVSGSAIKPNPVKYCWRFLLSSAWVGLSFLFLELLYAVSWLGEGLCWCTGMFLSLESSLEITCWVMSSRHVKPGKGSTWKLFNLWILGVHVTRTWNYKKCAWPAPEISVITSFIMYSTWFYWLCSFSLCLYVFGTCLPSSP